MYRRPGSLSAVPGPSERDQLQAALGERYVLDRELGRGGMATVFLARDTKHDRPVALKLLHPDLAAALGPERFRREIALAARLQHPHILSVHDSGEGAPGQLWFTMPFVSGETLRARLQRERQLPTSEAIGITREIALALDYAHRNGVVHRDIKPENILLTDDRQALVADFGIARALNAGGGGAVPGATSLTETGLALGTPQYMSPEQASGDRTLDARSDVYALGAVCFEMLAGEPPYTGPTPQAVIAKMMMARTAPSVRTLRPGVSEAIDAVIRRALDPIAADRFATAAEMARALDAADRAGSGPSAVAPPSGSGPTGTGVAASGGALTGAGPVGAGGLPRAGGAGGVAAGVPPASGTLPPVRRRVPVAALALGLGVLLGGGVLFAWRSSRTGAALAAGADASRVAVLPFDNVGDSADAYFADGLTDAVRTKLAAVPGIEVIASGSSAQYRHTTKTPREIGRELGVRYLLVGKVRWAKVPGGAGRIDVEPELVDTTTGADKWAASYDTTLTDVFAVQGSIAGQTARELGVAIGARQKAELDSAPTRDVAAYDAYLKGSALLPRTFGQDVAAKRQAIAFFRQATALDPAFALAWARLGLVETRLYVSEPDSALGAQAKSDIDRALALAPTLVRGHHALGAYYGNVAQDEAHSLAEDSIALIESPNDIEVLGSISSSYTRVGRTLDAVRVLERAQVLDPRSVGTADRLSLALMLAGRWPEAITVANRGLALDPSNSELLDNEAAAMLYLHDFDHARAAADRAVALSPDNATAVMLQAAVRALAGDLDSAHAILGHLSAGIHRDELALMMAGVGFDWILDADGQARVLGASQRRAEVAGTHPYDWAIEHTYLYELRGEPAKARAWADTARRLAAAAVATDPRNLWATVALGTAKGYLGQRDDALRDLARAVPLAETTTDRYGVQYQVARVHLATGDREGAVQALQTALDMPTPWLTREALAVDPTWSSLHDLASFQRLVAPVKGKG